MSSSFEKSVKGATKIKNAPPKTKYIEHILVATHSGEGGIAEVIRALQYRLRDSTWTVVFKSLITVHLMIREGSPDVTLAYLSKNRNSLAISNFTDAVTQGKNIRHYASYLSERARVYRETKTDWVRAAESRLEQVSVDKGLLRQTEAVQRQLGALLKCDVLENEVENEITITVFRLLVLDLLSLFQVLNQGLINILGHFFEMSKNDAERAMEIYRTFTRQTDSVVQYLSVARMHEHHTRVQVPKLKHAPIHLSRQLEDYLKDDDFEVHRRQYIAEQEAKGKGSSSFSKKMEFSPPTTSSKAFASTSSSKPAAETRPETKPTANKGPDPDLIDFFDSIEQNQTTMQVTPEQNLGFQAQQQTGFQAQPTGFQPQPTGFQNNGFANPYQQPEIMLQAPQIQGAPQLQPMFTGAGFGGYTPQPQPQQMPLQFQNSLGSIPQSQEVNTFQNQAGISQGGLQPGALQPMQTGSTNPFRQSMLMPQQTSSPVSPSNLSSPSNTPGNRLSTNPFARQLSPQNTTAAPLQATPTGTNPFARQASPPAVGAGGGSLAPQPTGTTNPFRQSAFVNHTTGMGWQHNQQPIGGGLDALPTTQIFPRPLQQSPWQGQ